MGIFSGRLRERSAAAGRTVTRWLRGDNPLGLIAMGMSRSDRTVWAEPVTLAGLGEQTARWLEREVISQPGYQPGHGPDTETEHLVPVLARACRAGFVTDGSQPGVDESSRPDLAGPGPRFQQRAAVEGFCSSAAAERIRAAAEAAGLLVLDVVPADVWRYDYSGCVEVTRCGSEVLTSFGGRPTWRDLERVRFAECNDTMLEVLCWAHLVTVVDPQWGRDDLLWPTLDRALRSTRCRSPPLRGPGPRAPRSGPPRGIATR